MPYKMQRFIIEQFANETYPSHSKFALTDLCLNHYSTHHRTLKSEEPLSHGTAHCDIVKSYLGMLCLGKSDFEASENGRNNSYFKEALSLE